MSPQITPIRAGPIAADDPDLTEAMRLHRLKWSDFPIGGRSLRQVADGLIGCPRVERLVLAPLRSLRRGDGHTRRPSSDSSATRTTGLFDQNRCRATKRKRSRRTLRAPFYIP